MLPLVSAKPAIQISYIDFFNLIRVVKKVIKRLLKGSGNSLLKCCVEFGHRYFFKFMMHSSVHYLIYLVVKKNPREQILVLILSIAYLFVVVSTIFLLPKHQNLSVKSQSHNNSIFKRKVDCVNVNALFSPSYYKSVINKEQNASRLLIQFAAAFIFLIGICLSFAVKKFSIARFRYFCFYIKRPRFLRI